MKGLMLTALLFFSFHVLGAEALPVATGIVQKAKAERFEFDGGEFSSTERTITLHDLTGDGRPEEFVDASQFSCSTAASMWSGTGGTYLWVVIEGKAYEFIAHQWRVVELGSAKILLLAVHSSECGDTIGPCFRALTWDEGFRTTR